jgi:hypothetical protein
VTVAEWAGVVDRVEKWGTVKLHNYVSLFSSFYNIFFFRKVGKFNEKIHSNYRLAGLKEE